MFDIGWRHYFEDKIDMNVGLGGKTRPPSNYDGFRRIMSRISFESTI